MLPKESVARGKPGGSGTKTSIARVALLGRLAVKATRMESQFRAEFMGWANFALGAIALGAITLGDGVG
jgi:hypothetical protein